MSTITVSALIKASIEKVWLYYTSPNHIVKWNFSSEDWICPSAENDVTVGSTFKIRMEAKDGSRGFDFTGKYTAVIKNKLINYVMSDGRKVNVRFIPEKEKVKLEITFEAENTYSLEHQRSGWQAILNRFKEYVEGN